jgi:hypothetical protein
MTLTYLQYMAFFFMVGWVTGEVMNIPHLHKIYLGIFTTVIGFIVHDGFSRTKDELMKFFKTKNNNK